MEILINPPKKIPVTKEAFHNFSFYDLACFWCSWRLAFEYDDNNDIVAYTNNESFMCACLRSRRFKGITLYEMPSAEMYRCTIPKEDILYNFIENKLKHLIMV